LRKLQEKKKEREDLKIRDVFRVQDPIEEIHVAKPQRGRKKKFQEPLSEQELSAKEPEPPAHSEQEPLALSEPEPPKLFLLFYVLTRIFY